MTPPTQGGSGGKSASAKSAAKKTDKKPAGSKKPAAKKRGKKKKGGSGYRFLLAFAAGLAVACLGFWLLRDVDVRPVERSAPQAVTQKDTSPVAKVAPSAAKPAPQQDTPVLPRIAERPPKAPKAEERPPRAAKETATAPIDRMERGREVADAVQSALADLQNLMVYEEGDVHAPLSILPSRPRSRSAGEIPKLAIVIDDLGANERAVRQLLDLDFPVSFAFLPHGKHTRAGARAAHAKGREVLVHQPMEPIGYPKVKPGPDALLTGMGERQIRRILEASIAAVPHAVGLNNHMGSRFTQQADGVRVVIRVLKERGLFALDSLTHKDSVFADQGGRLGIERYSRNVFLDAAPSREQILEELRRAEAIALLTGQAVAIGHPHPETLAALKDWERLRNRDVRIVRLRELRHDN